jgi:hypothetical protein
MVFLLTLFYPLSFCDKKGGVIFDLDRDYIFNRSSDFCPRMAKWEFVSFCVGCILLDKITSM